MVPDHIVMAFAFYLLLKAILFFGDFFSVIDGIVGIYMLLMILFCIETVYRDSKLHLCRIPFDQGYCKLVLMACYFDEVMF